MLIKFKRFIKGILFEKRRIRATNRNKNLKSIEQQRLILMMTPEYGNLGDHAIAKASINFLEKLNMPIIEVTQKDLIYDFTNILKHIKNDDIILISGGGYFGSLWKDDGEYIVRKIITKCQNNKIIILPMTMYFENNDLGKKELVQTKKIYSQHKNLSICCREKNTYNLIIKEKIYKDDSVFLVPDIVFTLDYQIMTKKNNIILFCCREDKEKKIDIDFADIKKSLIKKGFIITNTTTRLNQEILVNERDMLLKEKLDEFYNARLVITDRLHGMIFSYITHTPCIVMDNTSNKVSGVYEWIEKENSVFFAKDENDIRSNIESLLKISKLDEREKFHSYFDIIIDLIKEER